MENNNMDELIKKAQEMIKNNQVPDEIKQIANSITSNNSNSKSTNNSFTSLNSNIDLNRLNSIMSSINNSTDDDLTRLLFALKPYLRNERKSKIDDYVKLIRMGKMAKLLDILGGDKIE